MSGKRPASSSPATPKPEEKKDRGGGSQTPDAGSRAPVKRRSLRLKQQDEPKAHKKDSIGSDPFEGPAKPTRKPESKKVKKDDKGKHPYEDPAKPKGDSKSKGDPRPGPRSKSPKGPRKGGPRSRSPQGRKEGK